MNDIEIRNYTRTAEDYAQRILDNKNGRYQTCDVNLRGGTTIKTDIFELVIGPSETNLYVEGSKNYSYNRLFAVKSKKEYIQKYEVYHDIEIVNTYYLDGEKVNKTVFDSEFKWLLKDIRYSI